MSLAAGTKVYDESNIAELIGDGVSVIACGDKRLLARTPKPEGFDDSGFAVSWEDSGLTLIPDSEWEARLKEQADKRMRVSDYCDFPAYDQNGLPTCWANGPSQAFTVMRRKMGLPLKIMSACSLAVPISGGHSGGFEGDALNYQAKYGQVSVDIWPNNSTDRSLMNDARCQADREYHHSLKWVDLGNDRRKWITAAILGLPGAFAYNWMSHVMMSADIVFDAGIPIFKCRNSWTDGWGDKNALGFGGFGHFRQFPDSGYALMQVTQSIK